MNQQDAAAVGAQRQAPIVVPVEPVSEPARKREAPKQDAVQEEIAPAAPPASMAKSVAEVDRNAAKDESKTRAQEKLKASAKIVPQPAARVAAPPAPVATPPPPEAAPQAFPEAGRERNETGSTAASSDQAAGVGGAMAPAQKRAASDAELAQPAAAPLSSSVELRRDLQLAPEDWLSHIHQLLRQGRRQQATESLRLFRRAHPDWTVPDDLRPLLD
jgi:Meckel syndrome type 1 protein